MLVCGSDFSSLEQVLVNGWSFQTDLVVPLGDAPSQNKASPVLVQVYVSCEKEQMGEPENRGRGEAFLLSV